MVETADQLALPSAHSAHLPSTSSLDTPASRRVLLRRSAFVALTAGSVSSLRGGEAHEQAHVSFPSDVKGSFVIGGGGPLPQTIPDYFAELAEGEIFIVPTANQDPNGDVYSYWEGRKDAHLTRFHAINRDQANDPDFAKLLRRAKALWFSSGNQFRLSGAYSGTRAQEEMKELLARGGVVGGTSAGASALSRRMLYRDQIMDGLDLLSHAVIDQHFDTRDRVDRVLRAIDRYPDCIGVGIAESTALIIHQGIVSVMGKGDVQIYTPSSNGMPPSPKILNAGKTMKIEGSVAQAVAR